MMQSQAVLVGGGLVSHAFSTAQMPTKAALTMRSQEVMVDGGHVSQAFCTAEMPTAAAVAMQSKLRVMVTSVVQHVLAAA